MSTLTINNSNKPTNMRLRLTYTSGQGNITISKIESCRTDGYDTTDLGSCTIYVKVGDDNRNFTKRGVYFYKNSNYSTLLEQNISFNTTGTQNVQITFDSDNSNISNSNFTTQINAGVKVPTLELGNGYDSSHRYTIPNSSEAISFRFTNTNGLTTYLQYYVGTWKNFTSKSSDGWYGYGITSAQVTEILTYLNNTQYPNLQVRASNENGDGDSLYFYMYVDSSIVPTLGSISVSAYCDVTGFENLFIKGLSKPIVTFNNAQGVEGSTISSYLIGQMTGDDRTNFVLSMTDNVSNTSNFNNLSVAGSNTISAYVKDSRTRNSVGASYIFNVIDYNTPSINSATLQRCLQDGTLDEDGEYALLTLSYKVYPVNDGTNDRNEKYLAYKINGLVVASISISNWEDTIQLVIGNGQFDTSQTYEIEFILQDRTTTTSKVVTLAPSKKLRSLYHGEDGEGVTWGRKASEPGFHDYLGANFHNGLKVDGTNIRPRTIMDLTTFSDITLNVSTNYNVTNLQLANSIGTGLTASASGITIGAGITKVLISAKGQYTTIANATNSRYIKIKKNTTEVCTARTQPISSGAGVSLAITPRLLDVTEGDVIGFAIQGASGDVFKSTDTWSYLSVEVID